MKNKFYNLKVIDKCSSNNLGKIHLSPTTNSSILFAFLILFFILIFYYILNYELLFKKEFFVNILKPNKSINQISLVIYAQKNTLQKFNIKGKLIAEDGCQENHKNINSTKRVFHLDFKESVKYGYHNEIFYELLEGSMKEGLANNINEFHNSLRSCDHKKGVNLYVVESFNVMDFILR
ncbi:hypothetical protein [Agarilytica rhodophyticola]|uniref:hypothetical protein n=1 Tax=Agarilytica rhodophyticola TaxID=1737490 RepID=UPI000B343C58|nr:hypothetical protein [Agarilytica rhodophyticola]